MKIKPLAWTEVLIGFWEAETLDGELLQIRDEHSGHCLHRVWDHKGVYPAIRLAEGLTLDKAFEVAQQYHEKWLEHYFVKRKVKTLEWSKQGSGYATEEIYTKVFPFSISYNCHESRGKFYVYSSFGQAEHFIGSFASLELAKSATQVTFEELINSLIDSCTIEV